MSNGVRSVVDDVVNMFDKLDKTAFIAFMDTHDGTDGVSGQFVGDLNELSRLVAAGIYMLGVKLGDRLSLPPEKAQEIALQAVLDDLKTAKEKDKSE